MESAHALPLSQPSTFDALVDRVWREINTPRARVEHQAVIRRLPGELEADWDQLLWEMRCTENVRVTPRPDGSVHVAWFVERQW